MGPVPIIPVGAWGAGSVWSRVGRVQTRNVTLVCEVQSLRPQTCSAPWFTHGETAPQRAFGLFSETKIPVSRPFHAGSVHKCRYHFELLFALVSGRHTVLFIFLDVSLCFLLTPFVPTAHIPVPPLTQPRFSCSLHSANREPGGGVTTAGGLRTLRALSSCGFGQRGVMAPFSAINSCPERGTRQLSL